MIFNQSEISALRAAVGEKLSYKRYIHTLGVEEMAKFLGRILMPERLDELCVAALLHDIAKELTYDLQIELLASSDVLCTEEDAETKPALHSIAAIPVVRRDFSSYVTDDILSAVANHTLGRANMSIFDEIIFISDYSEAGRKYPSCQNVREYLLNNVRDDNTRDANLNVLHTASLNAINSTIESLASRGEKIHSQTFLAKAYFEGIIK